MTTDALRAVVEKIMNRKAGTPVALMMQWNEETRISQRPASERKSKRRTDAAMRATEAAALDYAAGVKQLSMCWSEDDNQMGQPCKIQGVTVMCAADSKDCIPGSTAIDVLMTLLTSSDLPKILHDSKAWHKLLLSRPRTSQSPPGFVSPLRGVVMDTLLAAYILNPDKVISDHELQASTSVLLPADELPPNIVLPEAEVEEGADVHFLWRTGNAFLTQMSQTSPKALGLLQVHTRMGQASEHSPSSPSLQS